MLTLTKQMIFLGKSVVLELNRKINIEKYYLEVNFEYILKKALETLVKLKKHKIKIKKEN